MKRSITIATLLAICLTLFPIAIHRASAQGVKTRVIDRVVDVSGNPRRGYVTFILTQKTASGPAGIVSTGSSVSASLDAAGRFDVSIYSGTALNPKGYFQVWFSDTSTGRKELLGIYDIPQSSTPVTLAPYKVTDTNLAVQYTFASQADVTALIAAVSSYTISQLNGVSRTDNKVQKYQASSGNFIDSAMTDSPSAVTVPKDLNVTGNTTASGNSSVSGSSTVTGDHTVGGTVHATHFSGDGSALTGIGSGTGGVINTGSTTVGADSDHDLVGKLSLQTGTVERVGIEADGTIEIGGTVIVGGCAGTDDSTRLSAAVSTASGGWVVIPNSQTCAGSDITIPNLRIEKGGRLKPVSSHAITLNNFEAGNFQVFTNALAGQGTISFSGSSAQPALNPLWWATNTTPGTTDMTAAVQAALNASGGAGRVLVPESSFVITDSLTIPEYATGFAPLIIEGVNPFRSNLINKASSGKPTLLINRQLVIVRNLGFWGAAGFPNDGIKVSASLPNGNGRNYIEGCVAFVYGNGIYLENAQSVWILKNWGSVSGGSGTIPTGAGGGWTFGATDAFVHINTPSGGFNNHIVIRDNMNEGYPYKVYANRAGTDIAESVTIDGNQFEGGDNGIYLKGVNDFSIVGNYVGEGSTGYPIELDTCRGGEVSHNRLQFTSPTAKNSTVKLTNVFNTSFMGQFAAIWMVGTTSGLNFSGANVYALIDESSDKLYTATVVSDGVGVPRGMLDIHAGKAYWQSNTAATILYPGARAGDEIDKRTPAPATSPGWICTTAASTGALVQVTGSGPDPAVLADYYNSTAYDFRITMTTGGAVGTAVYKVEYKTAGGGAYANLVTGVTTTEVPRVITEILGGAFTIKWPAATYVNGDQWTLTAVVAPTWTAMPALP